MENIENIENNENNENNERKKEPLECECKDKDIISAEIGQCLNGAATAALLKAFEMHMRKWVIGACPFRCASAHDSKCHSLYSLIRVDNSRFDVGFSE